MIFRIVAFAGVLSLMMAVAAKAELSWSEAARTDLLTGNRQNNDQVEDRMLGNDYAMTGIQMREHQDDPIYIQVFGRRLCDSETTDCSGRTHAEFRLRAGRQGNAASSKDVFVGDQEYVTGISVCLNRRDTKIKGVSLIRGRISPDGTVAPVSGSASRKFERTNCHDWPRQVNCPVNQVVVGLRVYHDSLDGARAFRPFCAPINAPTGLRRPERPAIEIN